MTDAREKAIEVVCQGTLEGCRERGEYIEEFSAEEMRRLGIAFLKGCAASHRSYGIGVMFLNLINEVERARGTDAALWQPIDTVQLGKPLIFFWPNGGMNLAMIDSLDDFDEMPTHWRPLPDPPAKT